MDDPMQTVYVWLDDEGHRTVLLFALAAALGLASVIYFVVTGEGSPTRLQLVLILAAGAVLFYVSLRSTAF
jgi:hypothetical protein